MWRFHTTAWTPARVATVSYVVVPLLLRALDYTAFSLYQRTSFCRFKDVPVRFYRCVRSEDIIVRIETGDAESAVVWFERTGLAVIRTSMYSIGWAGRPVGAVRLDRLEALSCGSISFLLWLTSLG